jgi:S-adenosylmethionine decarboxylase
MTHLDPKYTSKFHLDADDQEGHVQGAIVAKNCGLADIFPVEPLSGGHLDSYAFTPCGFSANAVIAAPEFKSHYGNSEDSGLYFTVHVTPEQGYSYASFETNVPGDMFPGRNTSEVVSRVIKGFYPGRICITKFISHRNNHGMNYGSDSDYGRETGFVENVSGSSWNWEVDGYRRSEKVVYEFYGYDLVFASFVKE